MIKNINKYLIANFPLIWNIRLVPMLLITLIICAIYFGVGYFMTDPTPLNFRKFVDVYNLIYASAILIGILLLIFWAIQYNRNNALRAQYPQSNTWLYLEWLMIFVIVSFICLIPSALTMGKTLKWQSSVTKEQYESEERIMRLSKSLFSDNYRGNGGEKGIPITEDMDVNRSFFDTKNYTYEENAKLPNPISYIGHSLLHVHNEYQYLRLKASDTTSDQRLITHQWLVNQELDSLKGVIQDMIDIHKKYNMPINLSADKWESIFYNPPLYPIKRGFYINHYGTIYQSDTYNTYYTSIDQFYSYFYEYEKNHLSDDYYKYFVWVTFFLAMSFSLLFFSSRISSGRSWIFALLTAGILGFVQGFSVALSFVSNFMTDWDSANVLASYVGFLFWIIIFLIISVLLISKIIRRSVKGKSTIYINIWLWIIPILPLLFYGLYSSLLPYEEYYVFDREGAFRITLIFSTVYTIVAMYPISILVRKWRALPDE